MTDFENFLEAIHQGSDAIKLLEKMPQLASFRVTNEKYFSSPTNHWTYIGDTALHLAAASYRIEIAERLLEFGSDPNSLNRRNASPLHYAADGYVSDAEWNSERQEKIIRLLLKAGSNPAAADKNGATPLHRAVRTRCSLAVKILLDAGCNPLAINKAGSSAFHLAVQNTGRGGSGEKVAIEHQRQIITEFLARGVSISVKDGKGRSVFESAATSWVRELLGEFSK